MRVIPLALGLAIVAPAMSAFAQPALAAAASAARYSTSATEISALLDDPTARAVLVKHLPEIAQSEQIEMVRGMTLKDVQQFSPDRITDKTLAEIDADLAKLPAKNRDVNQHAQAPQANQAPLDHPAFGLNKTTPLGKAQL